MSHGNYIPLLSDGVHLRQSAKRDDNRESTTRCNKRVETWEQVAKASYDAQPLLLKGGLQAYGQVRVETSSCSALTRHHHLKVFRRFLPVRRLKSSPLAVLYAYTDKMYIPVARSVNCCATMNCLRAKHHVINLVIKNSWMIVAFYLAPVALLLLLLLYSSTLKSIMLWR